MTNRVTKHHCAPAGEMTGSPSREWIEQYFEVHDGFARPDWQAIARHIEDSFDEPRQDEAWRGAADEWLAGLIEDLGHGYWLGETDNFLIVTNESEPYAKNLARFPENALTRILTTLDGIASDRGYRKHVVIIFETADN